VSCDLSKYSTVQYSKNKQITIHSVRGRDKARPKNSTSELVVQDSDEIESAMSNLKPTASDTPRTKRKKRQKLSSLRANDQLKKAKTSTQAKGKSLYIPLGFILGTNNTLEHFFSRCKHVLTGDRSYMSPFMFEDIT
jgi:hypothetical protein